MKKIILGRYVKDAEGNETRYAGVLKNAVIPKDVEIEATHDAIIENCLFIR